MYKCYNEAVAWVNKQKPIRMKTNDGIIHVDNHNTTEIKLLMEQYYYGIEAKKDLYYKMVEYGVIKVKNN